MDEKVINWLMDGDPAIRYNTKLLLFAENSQEAQIQMMNQGWIKNILDAQQSNGHWGLDWYRPKWNCTHYMLLLLRHMNIQRDIDALGKMIEKLLTEHKCQDGGFSFWSIYKHGDICVNGMAINYASYFHRPDERYNSVIDHFLKTQMQDGGWNCRYLHKAVHSSFHTTLSVLEGIWSYRTAGGEYRLNELISSENRAVSFLLEHHLFLSHKTLQPVDPKMMKFCFPTHWHFDVMRCLEYFCNRKLPYKKEMDEALRLIQSKQDESGYWKLDYKHDGKMPLNMEKVGQRSRWITLRALYILSTYPFPSK